MCAGTGFDLVPIGHGADLRSTAAAAAAFGSFGESPLLEAKLIVLIEGVVFLLFDPFSLFLRAAPVLIFHEWVGCLISRAAARRGL